MKLLMSRLLQLYRLQQADSKIDRLRARLQKIEQALADRSALKKIELYAAKTQAAADKASKLLRQEEIKVSDQRIKIEQSESILYGGKVRNPKELQDLQNELLALKRFLGTLEDRQLDAMLVMEDASEKNQAAQERLASSNRKFADMRAKLKAEKASTEQQLEQMTANRQVASGSVDGDDLRFYEGLREKRAGVAVARVQDGACMACGSTLTAALHQAARSPSQLSCCETCGRILYAS
jgi:predicted  nucleic acid-binding Zn-ribbon protein